VPLLSADIELTTFALQAATATLANSTEALPVSLATYGAPHLVPKVPVRRASGATTDVKVAHAAPRAVVPRARVELVTGPGISHRHLNANPGSQFTLNFANVPRKGAETRTLGRDDARNSYLECRATWGTVGRCQGLSSIGRVGG
jgi:hypothetical protein